MIWCIRVTGLKDYDGDGVALTVTLTVTLDVRIYKMLYFPNMFVVIHNTRFRLWWKIYTLLKYEKIVSNIFFAYCE